MENAKDTFCYEEDFDRDWPTLKPVERPCVLAGMLQGRLGILSVQAENLNDDFQIEEILQSKTTPGPCERAASSVDMAVDLLRRLSSELENTSILLALVEIHVGEGRKVCISGRWYGSYCEAALAIGRLFFCTIYAAADAEGYVEWLVADTQKPRGCKKLSAAAIKAHWPEIAKAIVDLPTVDWEELDLGIRNEWIEVRGTNPAPPEPVLPIVESTKDGDFITWEGTRFPVKEGWARAFTAMLEANGHAVGIQKHIGKTIPALKWLKSNAEPLHGLIKKGRGNSGYRLNVFDPPVNP